MEGSGKDEEIERRERGLGECTRICLLIWIKLFVRAWKAVEDVEC